jgi:hypothetical protein
MAGPFPWDQGTAADDAAAMEIVKARLAQGKDVSRATLQSASPEQKYVYYFDEKNQLQKAQNENYDEDAPKLTVYGSADSGYFRLDKQGNPVQVQQPNADALVEKAVDRQEKEALRNVRARNEAAGIGHVTDVERATIERDARAQGLDEATLKQRIFEFSQTQKLKDQEEARLAETAKANIAKTGAEVGLIGAQTGRTGAETGQIAAQTAALEAKTPVEIAETRTRIAQMEQQTEEARRKAGLPTIQALGEGPTYGVMSPTGQITEQVRQGYIPKTQAEVAARVGQLQAAARAKQDEITRKYPNEPEKALNEFNAWWSDNVEGQRQALQAAQEEAAFARGKDTAAMRQQALQQAQEAGQQVLQTYQAQAPYMVGPRAAEVANQAARGEQFDLAGAAFYDLPDVNAQRGRETQAALQWLMPNANAPQAAPNPNFGAIDITSGLNRTMYMPPGGTPAPGAAAPTTGAPAPVGGPTPEQLAAQRMASFQTEAATMQNQGGFGAIGANPMAAAMAQPEPAPVEEIPYEAPVPFLPQQPVAQPQWQPPRRRVPVAPRPAPAAAPVPAPAPVPFYQQALAAGLGGGGLGPMGPGPQTPIYDPAAEGLPVRPIWSPGGYAPPNYEYPGMYAGPTPY